MEKGMQRNEYCEYLNVNEETKMGKETGSEAPTDAEKAKYFNLRMPNDTRYVLGVAAAKEGVDMTKFILDAVEEKISKVLK